MRFWLILILLLAGCANKELLKPDKFSVKTRVDAHGEGVDHTDWSLTWDL